MWRRSVWAKLAAQPRQFQVSNGMAGEEANFLTRRLSVESSLAFFQGKHRTWKVYQPHWGINHMISVQS